MAAEAEADIWQLMLHFQFSAMYNTLTEPRDRACMQPQMLTASCWSTELVCVDAGFDPEHLLETVLAEQKNNVCSVVLHHFTAAAAASIDMLLH